MGIQIITIEEYEIILKRLDHIDKTIAAKIKPAKLVYTDAELCMLLSASKRTTIIWRQKGMIKFSKINSKIFYTWDDIQEFLKKYQGDFKDSTSLSSDIHT